MDKIKYNYSQDLDDSLAVEKWADSTFYLISELFQNQKRIRARDLQNQGIDLYLDIKGLGEQVKIDEKTKTRGLRKGTNFANQEILIELTNNRVPFKFWKNDPNPDIANIGAGWFLNKDTVTDYYFFLMPILKTQYVGFNGKLDAEYIDEKNFNCFLTSKTRIKQFLAQQGITENKIIDIIKKLAGPTSPDIKETPSWKTYTDPKSHIKFRRSKTNLIEQSISVVLEPHQMGKLSLINIECINGVMNAFSPLGNILQKVPKFILGNKLKTTIDNIDYGGIVTNIKYVKDEDTYYYKLDTSINYHPEHIFIKI